LASFILISHFRRWEENDQGRKSKITAKATTHKTAKVSMFNSQIEGRAYQIAPFTCQRKYGLDNLWSV
jgi:hypothetical protein